jgi:hypothetical protein
LAGTHHNLHSRLSRDLFGEANVAPALGRAEIDDSVYACIPRRFELVDCVGDGDRPAAECFSRAWRFVIGRDYMLVGQSETELRRIDGTQHSLNNTTARDHGLIYARISFRRVSDLQGFRRYGAGSRCPDEKLPARSHMSPDEG